MGSRINELLEKYWAGATTLEEEKEIKAHFAENPSLTPEGQFFRELGRKKDRKAPHLDIKKPGRSRWLSVAATLVIGFLAAFLVIRDARSQREFVVEDPEKALEITRRALLMVSTELNEGARHTTELKKINKAEEILKD